MKHERGQTDNGAFPNPYHYAWCVNCHRPWHWWMRFTSCDAPDGGGWKSVLEGS